MNPNDESQPAPVAPPSMNPYLSSDVTLVIPFDSPERLHWWKGGQSIAGTRAEVRAAMATVKGKDGYGVTV